MAPSMTGQFFASLENHPRVPEGKEDRRKKKRKEGREVYTDTVTPARATHRK